MEKFNLHEHIIRLQDKTLDFNELDVSSLTTRDIDIKLNYIIENLSDDPLNIKTEDIFDNLQSFIKNFDTLKSSTCNKLFDTVILGSNEQIKSIKRTSNTMLYTEESKSSLEMYGFLIYWLLDVAEQRSKMASQNKVKVGKGSRKITSEKWDWRNQCVKSLELMKKMLFIDINNIWVSQSERDTFINLFTKSIYQILEDPENVKDPNIKDLAYNIICICVKNYNHGFGAQTSIFLNLQSYDHLSEPMAELLYIMCTKYEVNKVIDDILIEISKYEFNEKDITSPKYFSKFLVKLSQILPRAILKKMVYLQNHLDADSYSMRMGMIEVIGNVLRFLISEDGLGTSKNQIYQYIGVLQERFADINSFCRSKVLQVLIDLCEINEQGKSLIPITKRNELVQLAVGRLYDKSSNVRKYAIKFLTKAVDTHPYNHDHRRLILSTFEEQLEQWELKLKEMKTKVKEHFEKIVEKSNENDDDNLDDDDDIFDEDMGLSKKILNMSNENEKENEIPTEKHIKICELFIRSYEDGIEFIHLIEDAVPTMCKLLASTSKPEVLEVMDFFVRIHYYQMECAEDGIKKMIHLIWVKDTNEEGKSIKDRLIESYQKIYFEIPDKKSEKDRINSIVRNLVSLTFHTTLAELTSLEQLLSTMMARNKIPIPIISKLWKIFTSNRMEMHKLQRRGALIILGMLAKADVEIISDKVDMLINVGFGTFGKKDLLLAKYTCIALQHYAGNGIKQKKETHYTRLPMSHPIFKRMLELLQEPTKSNHWYSVAEQVINTIYLLSEHPDLLCGGLIQKMSKKIFLTSAKPYVDSKASSTEVSQTIKKEENVNEDSNSNQEFTQTSQSQASGSRNPFYCDPFELSKLLFVVGHTAIKQIVHLENIENELKRRKSSDESNKKDFIADDIEQCVGSTEDEFTDVIQYIREREILYGKNSLLAVFGPMVTYICAHNKAFNDKHLQTIAVLTLSKFMCVSSEFCEQNLQLLFTILEKSEDSTIRSNISIALGDMTICFNNLIDQNIAYLYNRLNDTNSITKKNVLMVLTHLILNGMVKVKGQISEMAKCLENKDERISDLAKLFFTELSTKDNAVYNNLPDIISNLSSKTSGVSEEEFKNIMKYLFSFIDKDRQTENIIEKLCGRFKNTVNERQWRDISYCLSLLSYKSEKTIKKLFDQLKSYQDKLYEPTVHKCFLDIITKSKKQAKNDAKIIIEEFEEKLEEYHKQSVSHQKTLKRATDSQKRTKNSSSIEEDMENLTLDPEEREKIKEEEDENYEKRRKTNDNEIKEIRRSSKANEKSENNDEEDVDMENAENINNSDENTNDKNNIISIENEKPESKMDVDKEIKLVSVKDEVLSPVKEEFDIDKVPKKTKRKLKNRNMDNEDNEDNNEKDNGKVRKKKNRVISDNSKDEIDNKKSLRSRSSIDYNEQLDDKNETDITKNHQNLTKKSELKNSKSSTNPSIEESEDDTNIDIMDIEEDDDILSFENNIKQVDNDTDDDNEMGEKMISIIEDKEILNKDNNEQKINEIIDKEDDFLLQNGSVKKAKKSKNKSGKSKKNQRIIEENDDEREFDGNGDSDGDDFDNLLSGQDTKQDEEEKEDINSEDNKKIYYKEATSKKSSKKENKKNKSKNPPKSKYKSKSKSKSVILENEIESDISDELCF